MKLIGTAGGRLGRTARTVTQGGEFAREHGFAVSLSGAGESKGALRPDGAGLRPQGVVLCHQSRTIDFNERAAVLVESLPEEIVDEVLARVRTLLD